LHSEIRLELLHNFFGETDLMLPLVAMSFGHSRDAIVRQAWTAVLRNVQKEGEKK
jgi:hypothetical protein